jgi:ribonuclease HII
MILSPLQEWGLRVIQDTDSEFIIGIDEVGTGAGAGPFVVCGAVFNRLWKHPEVKDSKKFTTSGKQAHEKRLRVYNQYIKPACLMEDVDLVTHEDIDALGLYVALEDAIRRVAIRCSHAYPDSVVVVDGELFPFLQKPKAVVAIPKGDGLVPAVSAASIIAKTTRDAIMIKYGEIYPGYGFEQHMGYFVSHHVQALKKLGVCPIHRRSYKPVARAMSQSATE